MKPVIMVLIGMFGVKGKIRMNVGIIKYHHSSHLSLCWRFKTLFIRRNHSCLDWQVLVGSKILFWTLIWTLGFLYSQLHNVGSCLKQMGCNLKEENISVSNHWHPGMREKEENSSEHICKLTSFSLDAMARSKKLNPNMKMDTCRYLPEHQYKILMQQLSQITKW